MEYVKIKLSTFERLQENSNRAIKLAKENVCLNVIKYEHGDSLEFSSVVSVNDATDIIMKEVDVIGNNFNEAQKRSSDWHDKYLELNKMSIWQFFKYKRKNK